MELKEATAILQEKSQFFALKKANAKDLPAGDAWAQADNKYRVGILLKGRPQGAVFYYTKSMHEAKFLLVNILVAELVERVARSPVAFVPILVAQLVQRVALSPAFVA